MLTKIRLKVGDVEIEYEGPDTFLYEKLPEIIAQIQESTQIAMTALHKAQLQAAPPPPAQLPEPPKAEALPAPTKPTAEALTDPADVGLPAESGNGHKSLKDYVDDHAVADTQWSRFLAVAVWLHSKGQERLLASEVANIMDRHELRRIGNPSSCLSQNIRKGFCRRDGSAFYVTPKGRDAVS